MWELYDDLVNGISEIPLITDVVAGVGWSYVQGGKLQGVAMTIHESLEESDLGMIRGMPLKELAVMSKDWNFMKAGMGVAAINAYYNNFEQIEKNFKSGSTGKIYSEGNTFEAYLEETKDKKVALIGHFKHLENYLTQAASVAVLERRPQQGDYPDSACEYILPEQDYVFITGSTEVNKTLPRLLELSKNAKVVMVGPSTTLSPVLFEYGVDELSGFVITGEECRDAIAQGQHRGLFRNGIRISIRKK